MARDLSEQNRRLEEKVREQERALVQAKQENRELSMQVRKMQEASENEKKTKLELDKVGGRKG